MLLADDPDPHGAKAGWYLGYRGRCLGPYSLHTLQALVNRGKLRADDLAWTAGMGGWQPAKNISSLVFAAPPRFGYLRRHWRGELSLPVSYWINFVLLATLLSVALAQLQLSSLVEQAGVRVAGAVLLLFLLLVFGLSLWSLVGTWCASERHVLRGGTRGWAMAAQTCVILGALQLASLVAREIPDLRQSVEFITNRLQVHPSHLYLASRGGEVEIDGGLSFGTATALRKLLDVTPGIEVIQLNSYGGWMVEGDLLRRLIRDRGLTTFTARECDSACLLAFLGGRERLLGTHARLGFHQASIDGEAAAQGNRLFRDVFLESGIPQAFIDQALNTTPSNIWFPSRTQLLGAHIATGVVSERAFALSGLEGWRRRSARESDFAAIPGFAALRGADPGQFALLAERYASDVESGIAATTVGDELSEELTLRILPRFLKSAPDAALIAFWRNRLAQARLLDQRSPQYCRGLLPRVPDHSPIVPASLLPAALREQAAQNLGAVIADAAAAPAPMPAPVDVDRVLQRVVRAIGRRRPGSVRVVMRPQRYAGNAPGLCKSFIAVYETVLALPEEQAGPVLRYLSGIDQ